MSLKLVIRADGSNGIGTGHLMRCLALAQAWQEVGGQVVLARAMESPVLEDRLRSEGIEVVRLQAMPGSSDDAAQTAKLALSRGASWLVADGYHFDTNYQQALKAQGLSLLYIDDAGYAGEFVADIILNQNISAQEISYARRPPETRLLLGPQYALLRREFWRWRGWQRYTRPVANRILVTLGGVDPNNNTLKVIQALHQMDFPDLRARIVIGAASPHIVALQQAVGNTAGRFELIINTSQMPELIAWADIALNAGGSTCWELALLGLPMLVVILADNQRGVAEGLELHRAAINLGWYDNVPESSVSASLKALLLDEGRRLEMSRRSRQLVDGFGAARVVSILKQAICN